MGMEKKSGIHYYESNDSLNIDRRAGTAAQLVIVLALMPVIGSVWKITGGKILMSFFLLMERDEIRL